MKRLIIICLGFLLTFSSYSMPINVNAWAFGDSIGVKGTGVPGTDENQEDSLIHALRVGINRFLGILATISLVLCIYAGFKILVSGGDSKQYSGGFSILKNAAIGLAIIGTSRLIVSLIFRLVQGSINPNI